MLAAVGFNGCAQSAPEAGVVDDMQATEIQLSVQPGVPGAWDKYSEWQLHPALAPSLCNWGIVTILFRLS